MKRDNKGLTNILREKTAKNTGLILNYDERMKKSTDMKKKRKKLEKVREKGLTRRLKFDNIYELPARGLNLENDTVRKLEESESAIKKTANS